MKANAAKSQNTHCPKCRSLRLSNSVECPHCGIIYDKYQSYSSRKRYKRKIEKGEAFSQRLFYLDDKLNKGVVTGHAIVLIMLSLYSLPLIFSSIASNHANEAFIHLINIPFHEFGHIMFRPFNHWIMSLGGTIGQLLMPAIVVWAFLYKYYNGFGAAIGFWWFGENFVDIAPYINDARSLSMPLLGGNTGATAPYGFHDWQYILIEAGHISWDHGLAKFSHLLGALLMITALVWAAIVLVKEYKSLN